jgi:hypothetical protein
MRRLYHELYAGLESKVRIFVIEGEIEDGVKMAVPAQVLRFRGAGAASELARAGTIEVRAWDAVSCDQTGVWAPAHPKRAELYISWRNCQRLFVTNSTKKRSAFLV